MINDYVITLTDSQAKELIKRSEAAGNDDEHNFFQARVNDWLNDGNRLEHKEK